MIVPTRDPGVITADLVPQAVLDLPVDAFTERFRDFAQRGCDDLDRYEGVYFLLNEKLPFAVLHHEGYPPGTVELCLDGRIVDVDAVSTLISTILHRLGVPDDRIRWQRRDDPDL